MFKKFTKTINSGLKKASSSLIATMEVEEKLKPYLDQIKACIKRECPDAIQSVLISDTGSNMVACKIYPLLPLPLQLLINENDLALFIKKNAEYFLI